ncbi:MAG: class II glutamine amidotransferase [Oscillospiraceae bacterium]|nr:class II glutamine amidotransferase [Oscillospiraceae bacterium]
MCAVFGLIDYNRVFTTKQREKLLKVLSKECEIRGTDATGFAFNTREHLTIYKRPLAAHKLHIHLKDDANIIMGHTRMATQGDKFDNRNNHPFLGKIGGTEFALAHNGVLQNDFKLRTEMNLPPTPIKTDSYIAVQLLENSENLNSQTIAKMAEKVLGSFVFTILDDQNNMYFVKGDNPLALYHYESYGFYVYASTKEILDRALTKLGLLTLPHTEIHTTCGDVIKINSQGNLTCSQFDTTNLNAWDYSCLMLRRYWRSESIDTENQESSEISELKAFAISMGVLEEDIDMLLDYGYYPATIEELLYYPGDFYEGIYEPLGYDYCEEL